MKMIMSRRKLSPPNILLLFSLFSFPAANCFAFPKKSPAGAVTPSFPKAPRSAAAPLVSSSSSSLSSTGPGVEVMQPEFVGNILILDHINFNHENGRHDWLKAFYFDFLKCAADPRKEENLLKGKNTLWANIGAHQFHLPEGKPNAQVLQGCITLSYPDLSPVQARFQKIKQEQLKDTAFDMEVLTEEGETYLSVTDPWGSKFRLIQGFADEDVDTRGQQAKAEEAEGYGLTDLTVWVNENCNLDGVARFYKQMFGAPAIVFPSTPAACVVFVGPQQTLTFTPRPTDDQSSDPIQHEDLYNDNDKATPDGLPEFPSNYGPHISLYVADIFATYKRAEALGVAYVNPRFNRRAYNVDQAIDQCMFRVLDIVDPENPEDGAILKLEHEVRSVVQRDGSMYKSCPFDAIPSTCVQPGI